MCHGTNAQVLGSPSLDCLSESLIVRRALSSCSFILTVVSIHSENEVLIVLTTGAKISPGEGLGPLTAQRGSEGSSPLQSPAWKRLYTGSVPGFGWDSGGLGTWSQLGIIREEGLLPEKPAL